MKWNRPTTEELSAQVKLAGGVSNVCRVLNKSSRKTVYKWLRGESKIDFANWEMLKSYNDGV